ncbi:putative C6 transcription factor [Aspergillus saccharolyticus JOP 1030-1]|uniref:C6 transcription factor n=1 Tax=Aspergillus saccharolyticus JOP 1030-1 TaxID=1450539 RepID=A0A318ZGD0_9EURO|nr:C6 transcription factor [Aspergillus saccharolyticus JOP 1030-1]PYH43643.1 C6 transcription factor [Aspergillus saccharolyticus JOP 1030-1]
MFHTFEGFENPGLSNPTRGRNQRQPSVGRRVTTLRACTSCRHRKIKCDGEKPCEACRWYKKADQCQYSDPRPSRRHVEKLSTTLDEFRGVLEKLFPGFPAETLVNLPRETLLDLVGKGPSHVQTHPPHPASPATSASAEAHTSPASSEDGNLESLQTIPDHTSPLRPSKSSAFPSGISDDVNALSLSAQQPSSYLGVSSIHAVLKVIVWLDPGSLTHLSRTPAPGGRRGSIDLSSSPGSQNWQIHGMQPPLATPESRRASESQLLDAYFTYVQPFVPMLDEQTFRETYHSGRRTDEQWLALLNIVLALGSIAASPAHDTSHQTYFLKCKEYVNLECLGSSHLETIQALGLMGGYYLHYTSQPNLAYAIMGAALRMAAALGLHKELSDNQNGGNRERQSSTDQKRRVWWSLFCLDTWGGMTLGRPSMGRLGPTITVKLPHYREKGNVLDILPLLENVRFCKIATQIQEGLAASPLTKYHEMTQLDSQLLEWYDNLPYILKDHEPCSETIAFTRTVMKWRYLNQRMLLYRPTLLSYAMRRVPYIVLRSEERMAIERCREIAETTIHDIATRAQEHQMSGWNAVWLIFQAAMVPLLGLFLSDSTVDDPRATVEACQAQVETTMLVLARLQSWSPTAKSTLDAVRRLYEASKRNSALMSASSSIDNGSCSNMCEEGVSGAAGSLLSQGEFGRGVMVSLDNGFLDPFEAPFIDDSAGQYLWDFLSWSDSNLLQGFTDIDTGNPGILGPEGRHVKYGGDPIMLGGQLNDSTFFVSPAGPFY